MLVPIETIEAELQHVGLHSQVPTSERAFLGGLGADIEDAPIGYYRFHFWHNADTSKEHSNYVFLGKHSGYVCISLMADASYAEGRQFYRILIRTVMGWKACVVDGGQVQSSSRSETLLAAIQIALDRFCDSVLPESATTEEDADASVSEPTSPLDMAAIKVNTGDEKLKSDATISRNSSLSSVRSNFALSRLRGSLMSSHDSLALSRYGSFSSLADLAMPAEEQLVMDPERIRTVREELTRKFARNAVQIRDKDFPHRILELERSLVPRSFNFDVVNLADASSDAFRRFSESLGSDIDRKETVNYIKILTEKFQIAESLASATQARAEPAVVDGEKTLSVQTSKLVHIVNEFVETERNYLQQLKLIEETFILHLRNDDCGRFILRIKDFKDIFDGITNYIPVHEAFVQSLSKSADIQSFADALATLVSSRALYSYQSYFTTYEKRIEAMNCSLKTCAKFAQFHDDCVRNVTALNKKGLDQLLIAPIQRIPRYALLLKEILKHVAADEVAMSLKDSYTEVERVVQFLNTAKHKAEQTEMLFLMQRKIDNFPLDFLRAERIFLSKIGCFLADSGDGKMSKTRFTIYLCNDLVIFARKRNAGSGLITHDFVFASDIEHVQMSITRGKKAERMYFTVEIDMDYACFTNNLSELDSGLFGRKKSSSCLLNETSINSSFQFLPKNQKKLSAFINEFTEARNQYILSESPAALLFRRDEGRDMFYHVFTAEQFAAWESKSPVAIVYTEEGADIASHLGYLSGYEAVAVVQSRMNGFRFCVRHRNVAFHAGSCFEAKAELQPLHLFSRDFGKAVTNAHLLAAIYAPFSKGVLQQQRFVLESAVAASRSNGLGALPHSSSVKGFFSRLMGKTNDGTTGDRLTRGSSLKTASSPLSSPSKLASSARAEEIKKDIQFESAMSLLHL